MFTSSTTFTNTQGVLSCKSCFLNLITFQCDSNPVKPPIPYPDDYQDKWNGLFVRMPCSPESVYPVYEVRLFSGLMF